MKIILEFNIEDSFDEEAFEHAYKGSEYHSRIHEFSEHLRLKYKHTGIPDGEAGKEFEDLKKKFYEVFEDVPLW